MPKCSFGCGKNAIKQFGTGNWCCSLSPSSCTANRAKISARLTGHAGHPHSVETKLQISRRMKEIGAGGYREGSGRGYAGSYKGIWCDSSWELAFVLFCEIHGREVKRARKRFKYVFEGKDRTYLPDFRYKGSSGTWKYLEVKGFRSEQWKAKKAAFPHELLFIGKRVIQKQILPQVIKEYGKDFISLYADANERSEAKLLKMRARVKEQTAARELKRASALALKESQRLAIEERKALKLQEREARKAQRRETLHPSYSGSSNSQSGTYWVTNGLQNLKMKPGKKLPKGFYRGRVTLETRNWYTNGKSSIMVLSGTKPPKGFLPGRTP